VSFSIKLQLMTLLAFALAMGAVAADQFTPVIVSALNPSTEAFLATDGKHHVVYELLLINANPTPATIQKIEVLESTESPHALAVYHDRVLLSHLRSTGNTPVANTDIEFNGTRFLLIHLVFDQGASIPGHLVHRITLLGGATPAPVPRTPVALTYTVAPFAVLTKVPVIGLPLAGKGWVAFNGCCEITAAHRASSKTVNGRIYFSQRFAIDWMRLDDKGRLVHGDPADEHNYSGYGAEVLAVADGTVVSSLNNLDDQKPGTLPDPKTITLENVDGNHVVLDLGGGVWAFYAHLERDSVRVSRGDHVKRGQVLGSLGNTGNTSAPHLHFHLMDGPSTLGSNGLPYVIDSFEFAGAISATKFGEGEKLEGEWNQGMLPAPSPRHGQYPMDFAIINFPLINPPSVTDVSVREEPTPLLLSVRHAPVPFTGSDGRVHFVYELWITNFSSAEAPVESLDVLGDGAVLQKMDGAEIARRLQPAGLREATGVLAKSTQAEFFLHVSLAPGTAMPREIEHRISARVMAAPPGHQEITETGGTTVVDRRPVVRIGPPLLGDGFVSADSCCDATRHTRAALPVNGRVWIAQRFAVDWEQVDKAHCIYSGPRERLESYSIFGKPAIAVADATVESVTDGFPEETPGKYPSNILLSAADGNSVVLDLGDHRYALYAHLQPGSIRVHPHERVRSGQVLGLVGNSGNSVAPHLHFQIMDAPSSLRSSGLPYEIDEFQITGKTAGTEAFDKAEADGIPLVITPVNPAQRVQGGMPLDQLIITFVQR
jgi:murein DD-endopeptidase MepM/ murein hydrolase activator NlpD